MIIQYVVPPELEGRFSKLTNEECCDLISQAIYASDIELVQNMCLDILLKISNIEEKTSKIDKLEELIKSRPVAYVPVQEAAATAQTSTTVIKQQPTVAPKQEPKQRKELSKGIKNKNKKRFAKGLLR